MRPDSPSKFVPTIVSSDTSVSSHDVFTQGLFVITSSGLTLTLPAPERALDGYECIVVNHAAAAASIECTDGFPNDADSLTLAAGEGVYLYCAAVSQTDYRWISIGAVAA